VASPLRAVASGKKNSLQKHGRYAIVDRGGTGLYNHPYSAAINFAAAVRGRFLESQSYSEAEKRIVTCLQGDNAPVINKQPRILVQPEFSAQP
jgi:hypothetical protein